MSGGYKSLIVYQQAVLIFDLNEKFVKKYLDPYKDKRTIEQMQQASRSGKQNIVEGSLEKSSKLNIKLTAVSRASYGELLEDYDDFLRTRDLKAWQKDDLRLAPIRKMRISANLSNRSNETNYLCNNTSNNFSILAKRFNGKNKTKVNHFFAISHKNLWYCLNDSAINLFLIANTKGFSSQRKI